MSGLDGIFAAPGANAERIVPPPTDPMAVARAFLADTYTSPAGAYLLRFHRNTFHRYVGDHWPEDDDRRVSSELWQWLEIAVYWKATKKTEPPELVPVANGILDFATRELRDHTPDLFFGHVLPFAFHPRAPKPTRWLRFLDDLWYDDDDSKATLAEWFGYVLSSATNLQKMFLLVGPKRSGKGTIARVLTGLLGMHNVAAPTLASLTQNFGLQSLIRKPLAVISDARLGTRADNMVAVERLLSISGEDMLTVDRKYREPWTGRLPTRFMILTNELPRFTDSSGALASRFVVSTLRISFLGREDPKLTDELLEEAPSIFNWALEGLDRLRHRGYFVIPASAREAVRDLEDLASPIGAFLRDVCVVDPAYEVDKDALWQAWKNWCAEEGRSRPGTKAVFARDLHAAVPGLRSLRPRDGGDRWHAWRGLKLRQQRSRPLTTPDQGGSGESGQGSVGAKKPHNHAGGQGWSGVPPTVDPDFGEDATDEDLERGFVSEQNE